MLAHKRKRNIQPTESIGVLFSFFLFRQGLNLVHSYLSNRMLPQHHNGQQTYPVLDSIPNSPDGPSAASIQRLSGGTEGHVGSDILNLHRKGSKVWSEIRGKLMGRVGKNGHGNSVLCAKFMLLVRLFTQC